VAADGDVSKMGPKKMNADLKRDIQEKMDKLERRTQRAIVSLLKERLEREASQDVPDLD
jgi:coiled-coil domain-containing protein 12